MLEAGATLGRALVGGEGREEQRRETNGDSTAVGGVVGGEGDSGGPPTSDQSRVTHLGGQDWLLHASCSMGRWVRQWTSSSVSSSAGLIFRTHTTVRVRIPPSHVFPHSDQSPINHLGGEGKTFNPLSNWIQHSNTPFWFHREEYRDSKNDTREIFRRKSGKH